ncbi:hypothetical protein ABIB38_001773 [Massilia sp. UYP11]|uniref:hypothetical protein n=1 Tax=Massilia sp. UYP11 TaxID=1756385 RepID=UPI003D193379
MSQENQERIITDINADLVLNLDPKRKQFYETLEGKRKDYFLHMSRADQEALLKGGLDPAEEELMWKYASTLSLRIINKGFGLSDRAKRIGKIGRISLVLALVAGLSGIFTSTYLKNQKIQSLIPASAIAVSESKLEINAVQNELIKPDQLKTPADFLLSVKDCSPMGDISDSFYQANGKAFCKQDGLKVWLAGYVHVQNDYGNQAQAVLLKVEGGQVVNVEFAPGARNPFNGVTSVSLGSVEKELLAAFKKNNKGEGHE